MSRAPSVAATLLTGIAAASLGACAPVASVAPPAAPLPAAAFSEPAGAPTAARAAWWTAAGDSTLAELVAAAGDIGTVAIAEARLAEAGALARAAAAARGPTLGVNLQQSVALPDGGDAVGTSLARLEAALPVDVYGAVEARSGAAALRVRQSEAELEDTRLRARISAARLYVSVRAAQAQQASAARSLDAAEALLELAAARETARLGSGLETAQARTAVERARAVLPGLQLAERQGRLALEALLGRQVALDAHGAGGERLPQLGARELLTRPAAMVVDRPDLRAASTRLQAAGLDAFAARADRYPSLNLTAVLSASDARLAPSTQTAELGLGLVGVLFDQGRLRALAEAASAREREALEAWLQALRDAFAEVETQLEALRRAEDSLRLQQNLLAAAADELSLARARHAAGLADFSEVLLAQQTLADAERDLIAADTDRANAELGLLLAVGAGSAQAAS